MADVIKFKCKACEKKITVRAEYAGKKAKCPGCKQPLRVPSPRPKRSSTGVPIAAAAGDTGGSSAGAKSYSLADLAEMEANASAEIKELSHKAANRPNNIRIEGGKDCPGCGSQVKQEAVICVHCGHNFDSGKKLKTKKDSKVGKAFSAVKDSAAEVDGASAVMSVRFLIGGAALCILGVAMAFYDYRPDPSETSSDKNEFMAHVLAFIFDTIGGMAAGGLFILIGLGLVTYGLGFLKR